MGEPTRTLYPAEMVEDLFSLVRGKSSLANLSDHKGIPFVGTDHFVFSMDDEVDIVGENGRHSAGRISLEPVKTIPTKFEYGARVSDEFMYATQERKVKLLEDFHEGFSKKLGRGFDLAAMHGIVPRTGEPSEVIKDNHFDSKVTQTVTYNNLAADESLDDSIAVLNSAEIEATGVVVSKSFGADMSKVKENGMTVYPEFKFGCYPDNIGHMKLESNTTISSNGSRDIAIAGDFSAFKWGFGKDIELELIPYGDPDNTKKDLAGHGQIYIRATAYIGWSILDPDSFIRIVKPDLAA